MKTEVVGMCSFLVWGEWEAFPGYHGSDWVFRLLPLTRCLHSQDLDINLRKRNGIGNRSVLLFGSLASFLFLAPGKLVCLKGKWEWLLFLLLRRRILNMITNFPRLTCVPVCGAVWIVLGAAQAGAGVLPSSFGMGGPGRAKSWGGEWGGTWGTCSCGRLRSHHRQMEQPSGRSHAA